MGTLVGIGYRRVLLDRYRVTDSEGRFAGVTFHVDSMYRSPFSVDDGHIQQGVKLLNDLIWPCVAVL